jgi:TatA/E family protein of Tat protein translocase
MFGSLGTMELVVILVIALIVFGPRKLPELGRSLGKSLGEFKRASNDLRNTLEEEIHVEEQSRPAPAPAAAVPEDDPNSFEEEIHVEPQAHPAPAASAPAAATTADDPQHDTARTV